MIQRFYIIVSYKYENIQFWFFITSSVRSAFIFTSNKKLKSEFILLQFNAFPFSQGHLLSNLFSFLCSFQYRLAQKQNGLQYGCIPALCSSYIIYLFPCLRPSAQSSDGFIFVPFTLTDSILLDVILHYIGIAI